MTLGIHADSMHDLLDKLYELATDLMHHSAPMEQTSGGYSTGHHYRIVEDPDMDHDSYVAALNEWRSAVADTAEQGANDAPKPDRLRAQETP